MGCAASTWRRPGLRRGSAVNGGGRPHRARLPVIMAPYPYGVCGTAGLPARKRRRPPRRGAGAVEM